MIGCCFDEWHKANGKGVADSDELGKSCTEGSALCGGGTAQESECN